MLDAGVATNPVLGTLWTKYVPELLETTTPQWPTISTPDYLGLVTILAEWISSKRYGMLIKFNQYIISTLNSRYAFMF